jgi:hypothetical protein
MNKHDVIQAEVLELDPDIFGVTESWTHDGIHSADIALPGYRLARQDRKGTLNGRVVVCSSMLETL